MDCRVVVEAAVPVYDVSEPDEAVRIAISKTGEMLNPDLSYVEIETGERRCEGCGDAREPAFVVADEGLVALELALTVFNVEREEHAARIAQQEIGGELDDIPLEVLAVEVEDEEAAEADDSEGTTEADDDSEETIEGAGNEADTEGSETDLVPDVEELIEDE